MIKKIFNKIKKAINKENSQEAQFIDRRKGERRKGERRWMSKIFVDKEIKIDRRRGERRIGERRKS